MRKKTPDKTGKDEIMTDGREEQSPKVALDSYQKAIALQYDGSTAPEVVASGQGSIAAEIIEKFLS